MGAILSSTGEPEVQQPQAGGSMENSIIASILPTMTTVRANPVYEDDELIEVKLQFILESSTVTTIRICPRPQHLVRFVQDLDAGRNCELEDWQNKISVRNDTLVFQGNSLITHLPMSVFGKHLADALRNLEKEEK